MIVDVRGRNAWHDYLWVRCLVTWRVLLTWLSLWWHTELSFSTAPPRCFFFYHPRMFDNLCKMHFYVCVYLPYDCIETLRVATQPFPIRLCHVDTNRLTQGKYFDWIRWQYFYYTLRIVLCASVHILWVVCFDKRLQAFCMREKDHTVW